MNLMISQLLKRQILRLAIICLFIISSIISFNVRIVSAKEIESPELIQRISKDFTKKYCNAIAFGLSKESAMNFSYEENKKVFENKKDIDIINKEILAKEIADSVIDSCGYPIKLSGEKGSQEFKSYYLAKEEDSSS